MKLKWDDEKKSREARHQALLYLRDECGYSFRQIGRAMNLTKWEAEKRYSKARRRQRSTTRDYRSDLQLRCSQLQELAEILTGQPGTVIHFNGLRDLARALRTP